MDSTSAEGPSNVGKDNTPRRLNTANAATHSPQAGTRFISSCSRCKKRKIKCDAGIPSCRPCSDSNSSCEYRDTSANMDVPRARILHMEEQLQQLLNMQPTSGQQDRLSSTNITIDGIIQPDFRGRLVVSGIRLACSFCRKRKIKCDGTAPCTGCTKFSRPEECSILYEEASSQGRSYMSYLEDRISRLSQQLSAYGQPSSQPASYGNHTINYHRPQILDYQHESMLMGSQYSRESAQAEEPARALRSDDPDKYSDIFHELRNLSEASPAVISNQSMHTPWNFRVSLLSLAGYRDETGPFTNPLTAAIVQPLVQHYITEIHPTNPFLSISQLNQSVDKFLEGTATADEQCKVIMVIAIAASSTSEHPTSTATWNALRLFSRASYIAAYDPDTLTGLELNLLVLQFAVFNPSRINAWYLSGIGMRASAAQGLHVAMEPSPSEGAPSQQAELNKDEAEEQSQRRRLFWAGYAYDRVLSMSLGRPCGFAENAITVGMPDVPGLRSQNEGETFLLMRLRLIRQQSVIYTKFFQSDPKDSPGEQQIHSQLEEMKSAFDSWQAEASTMSDAFYTSLSLDIANLELLLYRPSRLIPTRSDKDMHKLLEVSIRAIGRSFTVVFHRPKQLYTYLMIPRIYTTGLALLYAASRLKYQGVMQPQLESTLSSSIAKVACVISRLSQEFLVGADLALRYVGLQEEYINWCNSDRVGTFPAPEIEEFATHCPSTLNKNPVDSSPWTNMMQQLMADAQAFQDDQVKTANADSASTRRQDSARPSAKRARLSEQSVEYTQPHKRANGDSYSDQTHQNGLAATTYNNMPAYENAIHPMLEYAPQNGAGLDHSLSNSTYTHLPHRPSLQSSYPGTASLTPLQQLAATAAGHTGQMQHDESMHRSMR